MFYNIFDDLVQVVNKKSNNGCKKPNSNFVFHQVCVRTILSSALTRDSEFKIYMNELYLSKFKL